MQIGDKAPFKGVLTSPEHYKQFTIDHFENKDLHLHMKEYVHCDPPQIFPDGSFKFIVGGMTVGFGLALVLYALSR